MNRIILIGNGFDLAHNMPTSYKNFIDDYWAKIISELANKNKFEPFENDEIKIVNPSNEFNANNYSALLEKIAELKASKDSDFLQIINFLQEDFFKNKFFKKITEKNSLKKWVDIENEYYDTLKNSLNSSTVFEDIDSLNKDFEAVKNLLIDYLNNEKKFGKQFIQNLSIIGSIKDKIHSPILSKDLNEKGINYWGEIIEEDINNNMKQNNSKFKYLLDIRYLEGTIPSNLKSRIKTLLKKNSNVYFNLIPDNTLFLTFNYTDTHKLYKNNPPADLSINNNYTNTLEIKIHGSINPNDKNPIIFGYGDELDDEYSKIEKLNDNRYLENIKSIKYSETDNYKKTLEFLDSDLFQVFLMGHSCGNSDRTLLNTIFEHENCVSIKPYYYQKKDGSDNYSDLVRNISRNFNDKIKMRDRLVNKSYCEPLS